MSSRRRIAVVGSGVSGLTAAHVLQTQADVTLYESDHRLGGHADTHEVAESDSDALNTLNVDTGFIVHNHRTYPTLLRLFAELGVRTQESDMSMSISCEECGIEYAGGRGISGLVPSVKAASSPRFLRMLLHVRRFHRLAHEMLDDEGDDRTLREFVRDNGFNSYFEQHFITPLVAAVWSTAPDRAGDYPARFLFSFLDNHGMLQVTGSPTWYTVVGGSARYVEKLAKGLTAVETSTPVRSVRRVTGGVEIRTDDDAVESFDGVVLAAHPHQSLAMLDGATALETQLLGALEYTRNPTMLHTDVSVLPRARNAQASWNYAMRHCVAAPDSVQVSYNMNRLQRLDELGARRTYVVTLNGADRVDPKSVLDVMDYEHPVYTTASVAARTRLPELNDGTVAYAGAYFGWGFHEDGARSGLEAARSLGVDW